MVDDDRVMVEVAISVFVDAVDSAIVVEVIASPIAAVVSAAGVTEAVVDATVEADVGTPVAAVEAVTPPIECPVAGGPQCSIIRSGDPGAGNPVVAEGWAVSPVAGSPDVVRTGGFGLLVGGQRRRGLVGLFNGLLAGVDLIVVGLIVA